MTKRKGVVISWYVEVLGGEDANKKLADLLGAEAGESFGSYVRCADGEQHSLCLVAEKIAKVLKDSRGTDGQPNFKIYKKKGCGEIGSSIGPQPSASSSERRRLKKSLMDGNGKPASFPSRRRPLARSLGTSRS